MGEILELKETINAMVDQLNGLSPEVTRVTRELGTEGKLGRQEQVPGVAGPWKDRCASRRSIDPGTPWAPRQDPFVPGDFRYYVAPASVAGAT